MTWLKVLPWVLFGLTAGALCYAVLEALRLYREVLLLRESLMNEKQEHYFTYNRLRRRDEKLGAMRRQLDGMGEIASSSAKLAKIYEGLVQTAQWRESEPMPLDNG